MNKEQILQDHVDKEQLDELSEGIWPAILDAMEEYRNQPPKSADYSINGNIPAGPNAGKSAGVKDPERYIEEMEAYSGHPGFDLYTDEEVRKALAAQAKDFEARLTENSLWTDADIEEAFWYGQQKSNGKPAYNVLTWFPYFKKEKLEERNQKPRG